jgi:hypothetical protein
MLSETQVADLNPLARASVNALFLSNTLVRDLRPLANVRLGYVALVGAKVEHLDGLANAGIIIIGGGHYTLAPLAGSKLERLEFAPSRIRDPMTLLTLPALRFLNVVDALSAEQLSPVIKAMEKRGGYDAILGSLREQLMYLQGDSVGLRLLGKTHQGRRVKVLPKWAPCSEARAVVAQFGAELPSLPDADMRQFFLEQIDGGIPWWLDMRVVDGSPVWGDGTPVDVRKFFEPQELLDLRDDDAFVGYRTEEGLRVRRMPAHGADSARIAAVWRE